MQVSGITLLLDEPLDLLNVRAAEKLGISPEEIHTLRIVRQSLDARKKGGFKFVFTLEINEPYAYKPIELSIGNGRPKQSKGRVVVVGMGPCGLVAAYILAREGYEPLVLERGKPLYEREKDFDLLCAEGILNEESNVCFGEGGAGAFSDGKLTTRIKDSRVRDVLEIFVECGAPENIRYLAKPHLGTENVRKIVANMRDKILQMGGEIKYSARLYDIAVKNGELCSIMYEQKGVSYTLDTHCAILAVGHSARDTIEMLQRRGVVLAAKPFAIGVRIEHPRTFIDDRQYGKYAGHPKLGTADYRVSTKHEGRGVYSFCVCPGGEVISSATERGSTAVNGMSYFARDSEFTNGAVVVSIQTSDFSGILGGMELQRKCERIAYSVADGYGAIAQKFADFADGKASISQHTSYRPYTCPGDLGECLPHFVTEALRAGIASFDKEIPGFAMEGTLIGVETRTSSPVRILRNGLGMSSVLGLIPAGEGAGYAGGIVSAAVDGFNAAMSALN